MVSALVLSMLYGADCKNDDRDGLDERRPVGKNSAGRCSLKPWRGLIPLLGFSRPSWTDVTQAESQHD